MAQIPTPHFGLLEYDEASVIRFPEGIPAFESDTAFLLIEKTETAPLLYLQSLVHPELCFYTVPAATLVSDYAFRPAPADLEPLASNPADLLTLLLLTFRENGAASANLKAPVLIGRHSHLGRQVILFDSDYSFEHPIGNPTVTESESPC